MSALGSAELTPMPSEIGKYFEGSDQLGQPEHFLDQNGLHPGVQSLAVLGVEAQPACGFQPTLPSAILRTLVTTA
jgi:hypothetical protein